jgi:FAD/FMN-containing dehydrogenase
MGAVDLNQRAVAELKGDLKGPVIQPANTEYEDARAIFNAMIERRPAIIAQCTDPDDVATAIQFARDLQLEIAVRGGGHSVAGMSLTDGGLVIDLRRMNDVTVDPDTKTVRVGGGATVGDLDRATQPYGLVTTGGRVSTTGMGGFTLSGGSGWLERKFGLASDNLIAVDLVTAGGDMVRASESENPDLFWALHGGGGNFGVATALTLKLHEMPTFSAALLMWSSDAGARVARAYRDMMSATPDEIGGGFLFLCPPPEPFVPEALVGKLACAVLVTYTGEEVELRELARPMLDLEPTGQMIAEMPYAQLQSMLDDPPGLRNYWSAEYLGAFPDPAIDLFCERAGDMVIPSPSQHVLFPQGGAVARGPSDYPIPWRRAPWAVHPFGLWEDAADDERGRQWAKDTIADMLPWSVGAVYLNFIGYEGEERVIAGVGPENHRRLREVKARYDPKNLFHLNQNIKPA